jgi:hypothetical protein
VFANGLEVAGTQGAILSAVIFLVGAALVWYSRAMQRAGVLN